ncbi:hypothetical protein ACQKWADRAFT_316213 [Trichoderma austrokoningii]
MIKAQLRKGDEFLFLEVQNKEFADLLGYNNDAFFIDTTGQRSQHIEEVIQRALTKPHILEQMSECSWGAGTNSSIDITMGPFNDKNNDENKATQEETQEMTQETIQETVFDLVSDDNSEDEFLSLPPSSPTLPPLKTPSKPPTGRWKEISKMLKEFKETRNS